jgi:hypothetical protein
MDDVKIIQKPRDANKWFGRFLLCMIFPPVGIICLISCGDAAELQGLPVVPILVIGVCCIPITVVIAMGIYGMLRNNDRTM